jgi:hypothetical protein
MPYDIHFESLPRGESRGFEFLTFGAYPQRVGIKGIQKLVNRVLKCLLTIKGSDIGDAEYGTNLMQAFVGNVDPSTIAELATMAIHDVERKIREYDSQKSSPADERLAGIEIEDMIIDPNGTGLELRILVRNAAGTRAITAIPLEID